MVLPQKQKKITRKEKIEYAILTNPVLWMEHNFGWIARDYQAEPLQSMMNFRQMVFRFGRRLGKTEIICGSALWHGFTQINKTHPDSYDILILCPFDAQVDLIFDRLNELLDKSPTLSKSVKRKVHHRIELMNGTTILGMTVGAKNSTGAANTRGQRADLIILDECDYMGEKEITNILNLRNESPDTIRIIAASTPCGKRGSYYRWCTQATTTYEAETDIINPQLRTKYKKIKKKQGEGNGWTQFYASSHVNKDLLKINPDTGKTYIEDFQDELTEERFEQEVLAKFGHEALGVFNKDYIDYAFAAGKHQKYYNRMTQIEKDKWREKHVLHKKIFGVDWDKTSAGPSLIGIMFDEKQKKFKVFLRIELPRTEFTYIDAVQEVINWNKEINPDWIYMDRGAGDVQAEMLIKYGKEFPSSGLATKVIANSLAEKTNIIDIFTRKRIKHPLKPTMINNAVMVFERKAILIPDDNKLRQQLEGYRIKRITATGVPVYEDENDHFVDALARALFGFAKQYDELFKATIVTKIKYIDGLDITQERPTLSTVEKSKKEIEAEKQFRIQTIEVRKKVSGANPFDPEYFSNSDTRNFGRRTVGRDAPSRRSWRK